MSSPELGRRLRRSALIGLIFGLLVMAAMAAWTGLGPLAQALTIASGKGFAIALLCSSVNYGLRFWKWELCLGWLEVRAEHPLSRLHSAWVYLAGLSMSISPGKMGEVLRSWLLRRTHEIPIARTAPVVVADRLSDLIALVMLASIGLGQLSDLAPLVLLTALGCFVLFWLASSRSRLRRLLALLAKVPALARRAKELDALTDAAAEVHRPARLGVLLLLSVVGWGLEGWGLQWVVQDFGNARIPWLDAQFLWSGSTLAGALSFLPGGLGASEASLVMTLPRFAIGLDETQAAAAALLARGATLWFGVALGALALGAWAIGPGRPPHEGEG